MKREVQPDLEIRTIHNGDCNDLTDAMVKIDKREYLPPLLEIYPSPTNVLTKDTDLKSVKGICCLRIDWEKNTSWFKYIPQTITIGTVINVIFLIIATFITFIFEETHTNIGERNIDLSVMLGVICLLQMLTIHKSSQIKIL